MNKMTSEREARILQSAVDTYSPMAQTDMMIEEMSELTKALLKYRRYCVSLPVGKDASATKMQECVDAVLEEMADCYIMLNQMALIYGDPTDWEIRKLERLEARLNGE